LDGLSHLYASERRIAALIQHQTRIVIGSAINFAAFEALRALPEEARRPALARAAADEGWLVRAIRARLPGWPFGYVPLHFLTKRLQRLWSHPRDLLRPKRVFLALVGFGFDAIVYVLAQYRMARGTGAGHW
jgi:HEAT repeat protein